MRNMSVSHRIFNFTRAAACPRRLRAATATERAGLRREIREFRVFPNETPETFLACSCAKTRLHSPM